MSQETDSTAFAYASVAELLPSPYEERPLGTFSAYVCGRLRYDIVLLEADELGVDDFEMEIINPLLEHIGVDDISSLLLPENIKARRVALLDLFLVQAVINNKRGIKEKEYEAIAEPETELEIMRRKLADIDGLDWHSMPWTLTGKDYPVNDLRRMFVDEDAAQVEQLVLVMQYLIEKNFFQIVSNLFNVVGDVHEAISADIVYMHMADTVTLLLQTVQFMKSLKNGIPEKYFERYIVKYYPSGAYAGEVYVLEAMLEGRSERLMRRINDAAVAKRSKMDPDILKLLDYVRNADNPLFAEIDFEGLEKMPGYIEAMHKAVEAFRKMHAGTAVRNTEGGSAELKIREPVVGSDGIVNAWDSLLGK